MTTKRQIHGTKYNTTDAIADHGKSPALLDKLHALEQEQLSLQSDLASLDRLAQPDPFLDASHLDLENIRLDLLSALEETDPGKLRQLLQAWLHKVTVERDGKQLILLIEYYMPPPVKTGTPGPFKQTTPGPADPGVVTYAYTRCPQGVTLYAHKFSTNIR